MVQKGVRETSRESREAVEGDVIRSGMKAAEVRTKGA